MATNTKNTNKTYDNTPEGIYNEALRRAKREIKQQVELIRSLGITEVQADDTTIMFKLIDMHESRILTSRADHIAPEKDPYSFVNRRSVQAIPTPTVEAPVAPTTPSFTAETKVVES